MMLKGSALVANMAKPSWCLAVMTRYFMPASRASFTQASASNCTGLNWGATAAYSAMGILAWSMICSP